MSRGQREKLHTAVIECSRHAEILGEDLSEQGGQSYCVDDLKSMSRQHLRLLDQMAYRFGKLQTALGERLLPLIFELQEEPIPDSVPFAQKLQGLERLGAIPSAEQWRRLRQVRNSIAHEYPDAPGLRAASLSRFIEGAGELLDFWRQVDEYLASSGLMHPGAKPAPSS